MSSLLPADGRSVDPAVRSVRLMELHGYGGGLTYSCTRCRPSRRLRLRAGRSRCRSGASRGGTICNTWLLAVRRVPTSASQSSQLDSQLFLGYRFRRRCRSCHWLRTCSTRRCRRPNRSLSWLVDQLSLGGGVCRRLCPNHLWP